MVDSVNVLILVARRVTIKDISEQVGISVGTVQKYCVKRPWLFKGHWVPTMLTTEHKVSTTRTVKTISKFGWEQLPNLPYCPDLTPYDFHLFDILKEFLQGTKFSNK